MLSDETVHVLFIWVSKLTRLPVFLLAEVGSPTPQEWARLQPWEEGAKVSQRGPRHVPESGHGLVSRRSFPFARMASGNVLCGDPGVSAVLSTGMGLVWFVSLFGNGHGSG